MKSTDNKRPYIRTPFNYKMVSSDYEPVSGESDTIPDQAFTIREILEKFTQGVLPELTKLSIYDDSEDFDDIDETRQPGFDLVDATMLLQEIEETKKAKRTEHKTKAPGDITKQKDSDKDDVGGREASQNAKVEQGANVLGGEPKTLIK